MKEYRDCKAVREDFSGLLDGELTSGEQEGIETHLAGCAGCLRELDSLKRVDGLYANMPPVSAPVGFEQAVRDTLRPKVVPMKRSGANMRVWGGMLAMAATVALVAGVTLWPSTEQNQRFDVASERSEQKSTPVESEFFAGDDKLLDAEKSTKGVVPVPSEVEAGFGNRAMVAQSRASGGSDTSEADAFDDSFIEKRRRVSDESEAHDLRGLKKETTMRIVASSSEALDEAIGELEARNIEHLEALGYLSSDEDAPTPLAREAVQREIEEARILDEIESKDKVARPSSVAGGAMLEPIYENSMTEEEVSAQRAADEAFRADALKQDLNRESITENGSTFRPNTPLPPSAPTAKSKPHTFRLQDARQVESEPRSRILGQRGVGDKVLRSFEQREGVWYESGYRDQKLITVERDSSELQRILVESPDLSEIVSWRAKVVFRVKDTWYALQTPKD